MKLVNKNIKIFYVDNLANYEHISILIYHVLYNYKDTIGFYNETKKNLYHEHNDELIQFLFMILHGQMNNKFHINSFSNHLDNMYKTLFYISLCNINVQLYYEQISIIRHKDINDL